MKVKAWIQMGVERRETVIEIPEEELGNRQTQDLEQGLEDYVLDWLRTQYGWGWSGAGFDIDFAFMEGMKDGSLVVTGNSSVPNTVAVRLCPHCRQPVKD